MGRSSGASSCLKIITCGSDSAAADQDDLLAPLENKSSSDRKVWSFRKRSPHHRVLSNTVTSETTSFAHKSDTESASISFQPQETTTAPEKISVIECNDVKPQLSTEADTKVSEKISVIECNDVKPQVSTEADTKVPEKICAIECNDIKPQVSTEADPKVSETIVITKDEGEVDPDLEESAVTVIQLAVRVFLAQKELVKRKNVVKLQAAVRGHMVRQHAIGTLRCVQAIVKMQMLVRARQARMLQEGSCSKRNTEKETSVSKSTFSYVSIEKLLSNKFAHQLMDSTPKTKPINIKCDPLKPNSAWNWLERWMSVSSAAPELVPDGVEMEKNEGAAFPEENRVTPESVETEKNESLASIVEDIVAPEGLHEITDSKETTEPIESEENLITYEADSFKLQEGLPSSLKDSLEEPEPEKENAFGGISNLLDKNRLLDSREQPDADAETGFLQITTMQGDANLQKLPNVEEVQPDQPKRSMKRVASDELENEGKKTVFGSRKASSPSFIAAQSKFEVLSSSANSNKTFSSLHQDGEAESNIDAASSGFASGIRSKELEITENSIPGSLKIQHRGSESSTELSVTSTLDSPDRFDDGAAEYNHDENKVSVEEEAQATSNIKEVSGDADSPSVNPALEDPASNFSLSLVHQTKEPHDVQSEPVNIQAELKLKTNALGMAQDLVSEGGGLARRASPEGSPRSHMTVPESQGTPSSQVSVKPKKNKTEKGSSSQKSKSHSAGKKSPKIPNTDSNASSVEQLPKDQKNGKRRSSFGSTKPDQTDQEPRDSSSSHSPLPRFMQVTESARAKIQANSSPRSSPDVHDREYTKKRHSLPGASGKEGSPRIQRSMSQAQQGTKGNGGQAVHEKKWQR